MVSSLQHMANVIIRDHLLPRHGVSQVTLMNMKYVACHRADGASVRSLMWAGCEPSVTGRHDAFSIWNTRGLTRVISSWELPRAASVWLLQTHTVPHIHYHVLFVCLFLNGLSMRYIIKSRRKGLDPWGVMKYWNHALYHTEHIVQNKTVECHLV